MNPDSDSESIMSLITNRTSADVLAIQKTLDSLGEQTVKMIQVGGQAEIANHINRCVDFLRVRSVELSPEGSGTVIAYGPTWMARSRSNKTKSARSKVNAATLLLGAPRSLTLEPRVSSRRAPLEGSRAGRDRASYGAR